MGSKNLCHVWTNVRTAMGITSKNSVVLPLFNRPCFKFFHTFADFLEDRGEHFLTGPGTPHTSFMQERYFHVLGLKYKSLFSSVVKTKKNNHHCSLTFWVFGKLKKNKTKYKKRITTAGVARLLIIIILFLHGDKKNL